MKSIFLAGLLGVAFYAGPADAARVQYHAVLSGAAEVPANTTTGGGELFATLDTNTKQLSYSLSFAGLTGKAAAAHFHGPAAATANAGVALPITGNLAEPVHATATLTNAQMQDLMAGKWYVNVHTEANKGGEIRGQLIRQR